MEILVPRRKPRVSRETAVNQLEVELKAEIDHLIERVSALEEAVHALSSATL